MNIQYVPIDTVTPYPKNAKKHTTDQIKALKKSITEFGFDQPIVVDIHKVIIKGHGRWRAAKDLEIEDIPIIVADHLKPEEVKMARLVDNDIVGADWDDYMLRDDLIDIQTGGGDINLACVSEGEFEKLIQATKDYSVEISGFHVGEIKTTIDCPKCGYRW